MSGDGELQLTLGYQARREGRLGDAKVCYEHATKVAREAKDDAMLAKSLARLAGIERDLNQTESALDLYKQAHLLYQELKEPLRAAHTIRHVADVAMELHQLELAEACYLEALAIYRVNPETDTLDLANTLRGYALLEDATGDTQAAISSWQEAGILYDHVWRQPGSPYTEADLMPGILESRKQIARLTGVVA